MKHIRFLSALAFFLIGFLPVSAQLTTPHHAEIEFGVGKPFPSGDNSARFHTGFLFKATEERWHRLSFNFENQLYPGAIYYASPINDLGISQDSGSFRMLSLSVGQELKIYQGESAMITFGGELGLGYVFTDRTTFIWEEYDIREEPRRLVRDWRGVSGLTSGYIGGTIWLTDIVSLYARGWLVGILTLDNTGFVNELVLSIEPEVRFGIHFMVGK